MLRSRKERENQSGHYRDHGIVHKSRKEKAKSQLSNENKNYLYLAKPSSSQHTWESFAFFKMFMSTLWSSGLGFRRTVKKGIIAGILFSFSLVTIIIISLNLFCWVNMPYKGSLFLKNKPKSG